MIHEIPNLLSAYPHLLLQHLEGFEFRVQCDGPETEKNDDDIPRKYTEYKGSQNNND